MRKNKGLKCRLPQVRPGNPLATRSQTGNLHSPSCPGVPNPKIYPQLFSKPLAMACPSSLFPFPIIYSDSGGKLYFPQPLPTCRISQIPLLAHAHSLVSAPKTWKHQGFPCDTPGRISEWQPTVTTLYQETERARKSKEMNTRNRHWEDDSIFN